MKNILLGLLALAFLASPAISKPVTLSDGNCSCTVPDGWTELADKSGEIMVRDDATGRVCNLKVITLPSDVSVTDPAFGESFNDKLKTDGYTITATSTFQYKGHDAFQTSATKDISGKTVDMYSMTIIISKKMYVMTVADASGDPQKDTDLSGFVSSITLPQS